MTEDGLFQRNLAFFRERFPSVAEIVVARREESIAALYEDGRPANIAIGDVRLYPEAGWAHAERQVAAYFDHPFRLVAEGPQGVVADSSRRLFEHLAEVYQTRHGHPVPPIPQSDNCYLVVIGIGLGYHLAEAARRARARHVVVLEPQVDFLRLSFEAIDWTALFAEIEAEGRTIDVIAHGDPGALIFGFEALMGARGFPFVDGTYVYQHYPSFATDRLRDDVRDRAALYVVSRGYYEDEIKMIRNCSDNLLRQPFRLIDGQPRPRRPEPVFVIGAGPSIDQAIPVIKKWQGHAIVFSAGTATQVLLRNGITPDFHIELENEKVIVDKIEHFANLFPETFTGKRCESIRLIASATVNTGVLDYFARRLLFFRDSVSSTQTFGARFRDIRGAAPYVANTALALASVLGFGEVYFFGVDCGSRQKDRFHSPHTVYYTTQLFKGVNDVEYSRVVPGNFGGNIHTTLTFYWSARMLQQIVEVYHLRAVNCSDGMLISGATPRAPGALRFAGPPLDKAKILAEIDAASPAIAPGQLLDPAEVERHLNDWDDLIATVDGIFAAALAEDEDFPAFHRRLTALVESLPGRWSNVGSMVVGSFLMYEKMGLYYVNRAADAHRRDILKDFIAEAGRLVGEICRGGRAIFAEVRDAQRDQPA